MPTYVYAVTAAGHPLRLEGLAGVGEPAGELRTLKTKSLSAVVSDAPPGLRAKRRDLVAHQSVLERLLADGAALPMRFGLIGPDDDQVLAALEENHDAYTARLEELDGCLEYNLKASRDEDDLLREIITGSEEIRRLNDLTRRDPGAHDQKMALGETLSREVQAHEDREGRDLAAALAPAALRHHIGEPAKADFLNVSFLVKRDAAASFSQAVHEEAERRGDAYSLRLNGPLPPYSFV